MHSKLNNIIINGYNLCQLLAGIECSLFIHVFGFLKLVHGYIIKKINQINRKPKLSDNYVVLAYLKLYIASKLAPLAPSDRYIKPSISSDPIAHLKLVADV